MRTQNRRSFAITVLVTLALTSGALAVGALPGYASPITLDLIVPSEVKIRSMPGIGGVGTPWGWVVATEMPLSLTQLDSAVFTLSTDTPNVTVSTTFYPSSEWTPMQPGDIAGLDNVPFTSTFRELQKPGEAVNPLSSNFWRWQINFPPQFVGEVNLHSTLEVDGAAAAFDTLLRFAPSYASDTDPLEIVAAQRIVVPEPATLSLLALGGLLALRRRR
jgi:hypothetical protein